MYMYVVCMNEMSEFMILVLQTNFGINSDVELTYPRAPVTRAQCSFTVALNISKVIVALKTNQ